MMTRSARMAMQIPFILTGETRKTLDIQRQNNRIKTAPLMICRTPLNDKRRPHTSLPISIHACLKIKVKDTVGLATKDNLSCQAGDVLVVLGENVGIDSVLAL
jgi:hypothetical protein